MLDLRRARPEDEDLVLTWRNEASARAASFSADEIKPEDHRAWFAHKLSDPDCALLILEEDGDPIGQVRLDRVSADLAEISIVLAPEARGRGLGREALRRTLISVPRLIAVRSVRALVKRDNAASLAVFDAAGFHIVGEHDQVLELLHRLPTVDPPA
jgi:RimJ/RimL family protein N-acetyltransferase